MVKFQKTVYLAFFPCLRYSNDDGSGGGWWDIDVFFLNIGGSDWMWG
jgi:hypothetical protein